LEDFKIATQLESVLNCTAERSIISAGMWPPQKRSMLTRRVARGGQFPPKFQKLH